MDFLSKLLGNLKQNIDNSAKSLPQPVIQKPVNRAYLNSKTLAPDSPHFNQWPSYIPPTPAGLNLVRYGYGPQFSLPISSQPGMNQNPMDFPGYHVGYGDMVQPPSQEANPIQGSYSRLQSSPSALSRLLGQR